MYLVTFHQCWPWHLQQHRSHFTEWIWHFYCNTHQENNMKTELKNTNMTESRSYTVRIITDSGFIQYINVNPPFQCSLRKALRWNITVFVSFLAISSLLYPHIHNVQCTTFSSKNACFDQCNSGCRAVPDAVVIPVLPCKSVIYMLATSWVQQTETGKALHTWPD